MVLEETDGGGDATMWLSEAAAASEWGERE